MVRSRHTFNNKADVEHFMCTLEHRLLLAQNEYRSVESHREALQRHITKISSQKQQENIVKLVRFAKHLNHRHLIGPFHGWSDIIHKKNRGKALMRSLVVRLKCAVLANVITQWKRILAHDYVRQEKITKAKFLVMRNNLAPGIFRKIANRYRHIFPKYTHSPTGYRGFFWYLLKNTPHLFYQL